MQNSRLPRYLLAVAWQPWILAALMAACSIAIQGFDFGVSNNTFHIPIVLRLYDQPQFAGDAYMQSLRNFVSPVYSVMSLVATETNIPAIFFLFHVATRWLTFHALLRIAMACGIAAGPRLAAVAATLVVTRCINGLSPVGADGMLINYFTHSELAQAVALQAIAFLLGGRLVMAAVLTGIGFDINAFVGVWMLAPLGLAACYVLARQPWAMAWPMLSQACIVFLALALPELLWIHAVVGRQSVNFDYNAYLAFYYGRHFFLSASTLHDLLKSACAALAGVVALACLRAPIWHWIVWLGLVAVFAAGAVLDPYLQSRFVLDLEPLRVDGLAIMCFAGFAAAAAVSRVNAAHPWQALCALGAVAGLIMGAWPVCLLSLLALFAATRVAMPALDRRFGDSVRMAVGHPAGALAVIGCAVCGHALATGYFSRHYFATADAVPDNIQLQGVWPASPEWRAAALWARGATPQDATFLVPPDLDGFRIAARRVTSPTWKEGASPMWAPATYAYWFTSLRDIRALPTLSARLDYACRHGFTFVVEDLRPGPLRLPAGRIPVFANRWFAVVPVRPCRTDAT